MAFAVEGDEALGLESHVGVQLRRLGVEVRNWRPGWARGNHDGYSQGVGQPAWQAVLEDRTVHDGGHVEPVDPRGNAHLQARLTFGCISLYCISGEILDYRAPWRETPVQGVGS